MFQLLNDFSAEKAVDQAKEHSEHAGGGAGSRRVFLLAAVLAVVAAIVSLLANQRATGALQAKNDAILAQARASDTYNYYEARSIKEHIYEAAIASNPAMAAATRSALDKVATHEKTDKAPLLKKAQELEAASAAAEVKSERLMREHEILEASVTLFEIAIAIISISALANSRLLSVLGFIAAGGGIVLFVYALIPGH
jgi:hypothetical protein